MAGCGVCVVPRVRIGSSPSHCPRPFMLSSLFFRLCVVCGEVRWGRAVLHCVCCRLCPSLLAFSLPLLCVLCRSDVGLVLCLCDRVVSLWGSGDGLCGGRRAGGVYCPLSAVRCPLSTLYVLWVVVCGMAGCAGVGGVGFGFFFPLPLCVGVRGSARAAMRART